MITPIPTRYHDYKMRSRLEARWAVFFDALGIKWVYEPEGFDLGAAGWYLPDYWLPDLGLWCEVKPAEPPAGELRKLQALAEGQGANVLLLMGEPGAPEEITENDPAYRYEPAYRSSYTGRLFVGDFPAAEEIAEHYFELRPRLDQLSTFLATKAAAGQVAGPVPEFDGHQATLQHLLDLDRAYYRRKYGQLHPHWQYGYTVDGLGWREAKPGQWSLSWAPQEPGIGEQRTPALLAAYAAARSARFEHGEQPIIERRPTPTLAPATTAAGWAWRRGATHTIAELCRASESQELLDDQGGAVGTLCGRLNAILLLPADEQGTCLRGSLSDGSGVVRLKVPRAVYEASAALWSTGARLLLTGRARRHEGSFAGAMIAEPGAVFHLPRTIFEVQAVQPWPR